MPFLENQGSPEGGMIVGVVGTWKDADVPLRLEPILCKEGVHYLLSSEVREGRPVQLHRIDSDLDSAVSEGAATWLSRPFMYQTGHVLVACTGDAVQYVPESSKVHGLLENLWVRHVENGERMLSMAPDIAVVELKRALRCRLHAGVVWAIAGLIPGGNQMQRLRSVPAAVQEEQILALPPRLRHFAMNVYREAQREQRLGAG